MIVIDDGMTSSLTFSLIFVKIYSNYCRQRTHVKGKCFFFFFFFSSTLLKTLKIKEIAVDAEQFALAVVATCRFRCRSIVDFISGLMIGFHVGFSRRFGRGSAGHKVFGGGLHFRLF